MFKFFLKKIIAYLFLLFFCSLCLAQFDTKVVLSKSEQAWLSQHPEIYVGYDAGYAPIDMTRDGKHRGIAADYISYISTQLQHSFVASHKGTWADTYEAALFREYDVLSCLHRTTTRSEHFLFSKPYISLDTAIITASNRAPMLRDMSMEDLDGKKVAVVAGYFWEDILNEYHPNIKIVKVHSMDEGLIEVAFGSVDAYLGILAPVTYYIAQQNISNLVVAGKTPHRISFSIAVRKDWPELLGIINKVIDTIPMKERMLIEDRWIRLSAVNEKRSDFLLKVFTAFSLFLLVLIFMIWTWGKTMKLQVARRTKELATLNATLEQRVTGRTKELVVMNEKLTGLHKKLEEDNETLAHLANVDSLTSIANRRMFDAKLQAVFDDRNNYEEKLPMSLLMIDIDYFKQLNDYYGHQKGDDVLEQVATALTKNLRRSSELVARYGGEEFVIFIENCTQQQAIAMAEKKRQAIESLSIEHLNSMVSNCLTISIGIAVVPQGKYVSPEKMLAVADKALYEAKNAGRNRVIHKLVAD